MLFGPVGGDAHQAGGGQVRDVADDGDHLVMPVGRHRHHLGAELGDDTRDVGERDVVGPGDGRQHPYGAVEHRRIGTVETVELAAGHRVAADETRVVDGCGDGALHPADVGDDARGLGERPFDLVGDGEDGHGDERDVSALIEAGGVDAAAGPGVLDAGSIDVVAGDMPARTRAGRGRSSRRSAPSPMTLARRSTGAKRTGRGSAPSGR